MELEKIYPGADTGKDAILKLGRNQKVISESINENTNQINENTNQINKNTNQINKNTNQINDLNNKFCSFKTFSSDSFLNGWEQYSGSELRYNKIGNIVFLFGTISGANGVLTLGTTILNLPAEFPPSSHTRIELFTNTGILIPGLIRYNTKTLELQKDANATTYHINGFYYTNS